MLMNFVLGLLRGDPGQIIGNLRVTQILDIALALSGVLPAVWFRRQSASAS
jgi:hypothetical protein